MLLTFLQARNYNQYHGIVRVWGSLTVPDCWLAERRRSSRLIPVWHRVQLLAEDTQIGSALSCQITLSRQRGSNVRWREKRYRTDGEVVTVVLCATNLAQTDQ